MERAKYVPLTELHVLLGPVLHVALMSGVGVGRCFGQGWDHWVLGQVLCLFYCICGDGSRPMGVPVGRSRYWRIDVSCFLIWQAGRVTACTRGSTSEFVTAHGTDRPTLGQPRKDQSCLTLAGM